MMASASNRPPCTRWYIAEPAIATIGMKAYSPSRRIRSMSTWPGGVHPVHGERPGEQAHGEQRHTGHRHPRAALADPGGHPEATGGGRGDAGAEHGQPGPGAAARATTIEARPAASAAVTDASRMAGQAVGVAGPSSRVGSEKSTQPTNQSAAAMTNPSSSEPRGGGPGHHRAGQPEQPGAERQPGHRRADGHQRRPAHTLAALVRPVVGRAEHATTPATRLARATAAAGGEQQVRLPARAAAPPGRRRPAARRPAAASRPLTPHGDHARGEMHDLNCAGSASRRTGCRVCICWDTA